MAEKRHGAPIREPPVNLRATDCKTTVPSAGRRSSCRNGQSILIAIAYDICGNAKRAATNSRRSFHSLKQHNSRSRPESQKSHRVHPVALLRLNMQGLITSARKRPLADRLRRGCSGLLLRQRPRSCRQLQYGRTLAIAQTREQDDLPVREFKRVV